MSKEEKVKLASEKLQEFLKKENIIFDAAPAFIKRDDGTFSVQIQVRVDYKKQQAENVK